MKQYKWCYPTAKNFNQCENWTCRCGHLRMSHHNGVDFVSKPGTSCSNGCSCSKFIYLNNDQCTTECAFLRKIYEIDN